MTSWWVDECFQTRNFRGFPMVTNTNENSCCASWFNSNAQWSGYATRDNAPAGRTSAATLRGNRLPNPTIGFCNQSLPSWGCWMRWKSCFCYKPSIKVTEFTQLCSQTVFFPPMKWINSIEMNYVSRTTVETARRWPVIIVSTFEVLEHNISPQFHSIEFISISP